MAFMPILGILLMLGIALAMSKSRKQAILRWDMVAWGLGLQFVFALFILRTDVGEWIFDKLNDAFVALIDCTKAGAGFVFGPNLTEPTSGLGFFAFFVLPTIVFFSALTAMLYHIGLLQLVVKGIAWVMMRTMKTSGAETLSASANIFVGQTEAPLLVRPFVPTMTRSELMTVMTGGFATVAGGVMAAYIFYLQGIIPDIAGHLLAASVMSAPAALMFGKIIVPETETPVTAGNMKIEMKSGYDGVVDAVAGGTSEGVKLALNVGGMLIAFLAIIALINLILGGISNATQLTSIMPGQQPITLEWILGIIFYPLVVLMGVPWGDEAMHASSLLGIKIIANEFVAYPMLAEIGEQLSPRTRIIMAYALCGFANMGSIGIQIGGLAIMAPERRADIARLGMIAMIAGVFAANSTACIAAMLYREGDRQPSQAVVVEEVPDVPPLVLDEPPVEE